MSIKEENRICKHCKKDFTISEEEFSLYDKVGIELSTLCFFCRIKIHLSFWGFGKFRKGKSDLSGENLITILPENSRYPIYTQHEWYSDAWDPMNYGQDYDASRSFFEQLKELQEKIPRPHQMGKNNTGCDWCDDVWNSKNCYLSRALEKCEDLYYCYRNVNVKNSIDATICFDTEKSYDVSDVHKSFRIFYSMHSRDCINSYFLYDCRNCQDCFMSWNLRNKQYCIENVQYTKEEYKEKLKQINLGSYETIQSLKNKFNSLLKEEAIHRENQNLKTTNSTGNYLLNTKNCQNCHTLSDSEDCIHCIRGLNNKSCIDTNGTWYCELSGNCSACMEGYALKYSLWSSSRYCEYVDLCLECENCFGSIGLRKKKYCILNKQYSKEEYEKLKDQIISDMKKSGEYGKFLPYNMSTIPFNFSTSATYFPDVKKEEVLALGGYWEDVNESHLEGIPTSELADSIQDVSDDIVRQALICPETGWRFNIAQNELSFYRENNIPLPREHFDVRNKERFKYMTVLKSYPYKCTFCENDIMAYYPPEWAYKKIACEECYKQNIA